MRYNLYIIKSQGSSLMVQQDWCCHRSGLGHCYDACSIPDLGTSMGHGPGPKNKTQKSNQITDPKESVQWVLTVVHTKDNTIPNQLEDISITPESSFSLTPGNQCSDFSVPQITVTHPKTSCKWNCTVFCVWILFLNIIILRIFRPHYCLIQWSWLLIAEFMFE